MTCQCGSGCGLYRAVRHGLTRGFVRYGEAVGRHPAPFILLPVLLLGGLGCGLLSLQWERDVERAYCPASSQAVTDRQRVRHLFPGDSAAGTAYSRFSHSDKPQAATLLFLTKDGRNLFGPDSDGIRSEISRVVKRVKDLWATSPLSGERLFLNTSCARRRGRLEARECVIDGELALDPAFRDDVDNGSVSYPVRAGAGGEPGTDLTSFLSNVSVSRAGKLTSATVLRLTFALHDTRPAWIQAFKALTAGLTLSHSNVYAEVPGSLAEEVEAGSQADGRLLVVTLGLCCVYATLVALGGDVVSTRAPLALAGIATTALALLGASGMLALCGVKVISVVGIVPFLVIGVGVDDVFLLMAAWSEVAAVPGDQPGGRTVGTLMGRALATAVPGITISSLTDVLAFVVGTTSPFLVVTNFSLYAGTALLFCYLGNLTLFAGCLAVHGHRTLSMRSALTCRPVQDKGQLRQEGRSACYLCWCAGSIPEKPRDDESVCERLPRWLLPKVVAKKGVCVLILVLFAGYLAVALYGTVNLEQGLRETDLLPPSSRYSSYRRLLDQFFPLVMPVAFVLDGQFDYQHRGRVFLDLLDEARDDPAVDSSFVHCWLNSFHQSLADQNVSYLDLAAENYVIKLNYSLQFNPQLSQFAADVAIRWKDEEKRQAQIVASRCYVKTLPNTDLHANSQTMSRMRRLADDSELPAFAFHWAFVCLEQFENVVPATLRMMGGALLLVVTVTFLFLPHPPMVALVAATVIMILTGVVGFMQLWGVRLSAVSVMHLVMSVGFSVDFSLHVCAAYLLSQSSSREDRTRDAIRRTASPIVNGAASTLLGIVAVAFSSSYVFLTFFKIMVLVLGFGLLHSVLFLPAMLTLFGPENYQAPSRRSSGPHDQDLKQGDEELPQPGESGGAEQPTNAAGNSTLNQTQPKLDTETGLPLLKPTAVPGQPEQVNVSSQSQLEPVIKTPNFEPQLEQSSQSHSQLEPVKASEQSQTKPVAASDQSQLS